MITDKERLEQLKREFERDGRYSSSIISKFSDDGLKEVYITQLEKDIDIFMVLNSFETDELRMKYLHLLQDEEYIFQIIMKFPRLKQKIQFMHKIVDCERLTKLVKSFERCSDNTDKIKESYFNEIESERIKAILATTIKDEKIRKKLISLITDDTSKATVIASLSADKDKLKYLEKGIFSPMSKMLIVLSLKDENLKRKILKQHLPGYTSFDAPKGITVGSEIEVEGPYSYVMHNIIKEPLPGWKTAIERTLENGVEIKSPILTNNTNDINDLGLIYHILGALKFHTSQRCGGHIHIGADALTTKEAYIALQEIVANTEKILFLIGNEPDQLPREQIKKSAMPMSSIFQFAKEKKEFEDVETVSKEQLIKYYKETQERRNSDVNYGNVDEKLNTVEFRFFNQPKNANVAIENIALAAGLVLGAEKIGKIQQNTLEKMSINDLMYLDLFKKIKRKETSEEEKATILLEICIPLNMRHAFIERYLTNKIALSRDKNLESYLDNNIAENFVLNERELSPNSRSQTLIDRMKEDIGEIDSQLLKYMSDLENRDIE